MTHTRGYRFRIRSSGRKHLCNQKQCQLLVCLLLLSSHFSSSPHPYSHLCKSAVLLYAWISKLMIVPRKGLISKFYVLGYTYWKTSETTNWFGDQCLGFIQTQCYGIVSQKWNNIPTLFVLGRDKMHPGYYIYSCHALK